MSVGQLETEEHRQGELEIARRLSCAFMCDCRPTDTFASFDLLAYRHGQMVGVVELKDRRGSDSYPTLWLAVSKHEPLMTLRRRLSNVAGKPFAVVFVWAFDDAIYWIDVEKAAGMPRAQGGRTDRGLGAYDIEEMIEVDRAQCGRVEW